MCLAMFCSVYQVTLVPSVRRRAHLRSTEPIVSKLAIAMGHPVTKSPVTVTAQRATVERDAKFETVPLTSMAKSAITSVNVIQTTRIAVTPGMVAVIANRYDSFGEIITPLFS